MYITHDIVCADVGNILNYKDTRAFKMPFKDGIYETPINTNNINVMGNVSFMDGIPIVAKTAEYGEIKKALIKLMYSNDDQIAIMLNKDSDPEGIERFNKMQAWRNWSSQIAEEIMNKL